MQQLGGDLVFPPRGSPGQLRTTANALAMAEAFDGAENVSDAYGYYIDQFSWRETAGLFARDGWKELSYIGTFIGKDRVTNSMIQRYGENGPSSRDADAAPEDPALRHRARRRQPRADPAAPAADEQLSDQSPAR
jgi:hypothetical protein